MDPEQIAGFQFAFSSSACLSSNPDNVALILAICPVGLQAGTDHIRVLRSCTDPDSTPPELAEGSHAAALLRWWEFGTS